MGEWAATGSVGVPPAAARSAGCGGQCGSPNGFVSPSGIGRSCSVVKERRSAVSGAPSRLRPRGGNGFVSLNGRAGRSWERRRPAGRGAQRRLWGTVRQLKWVRFVMCGHRLVFGCQGTERPGVRRPVSVAPRAAPTGAWQAFHYLGPKRLKGAFFLIERSGGGGVFGLRGGGGAGGFAAGGVEGGGGAGGASFSDLGGPSGSVSRVVAAASPPREGGGGR